MDLSAQEFWAQTPEEREAAFAHLRAEAPISWQRQPEGALMPELEGSGHAGWLRRASSRAR